MRGPAKQPMRTRFPKTRAVEGAPAYPLAIDPVRIAVTAEGGHLAPFEVEFGKRTISPLSVAPWHKEAHKLPAILRMLRGDFFCLPFGGNAERYRGETHPVHGETANGVWKPASYERTADRARMSFELATRARPGTVRKTVELRRGQSVVYQRHTLSGMRGRMPAGHHAMLHFRSPGLISTSPFLFGQVYPGQFENPAEGGYSSLREGAEFDRLDAVPARDGTVADLSRYPAREGFEDLVMICSTPGLQVGWTAVVFPEERFLWIAFKDPAVLASTVLWHSNGGRHYPPWNGRHRARLGLEEVTSYFHEGLKSSAEPNPLSKSGIPTALELNSRRATTINYLMAIAPVPARFDHVASVKRTDPDHVRITARNGSAITLAIDLDFLHGTD